MEHSRVARKDRRTACGALGRCGLAVATLAATYFLFAGSAAAWNYTNHCVGYGSGDQCWSNYSVAEWIQAVSDTTQYHRHEVCAKARGGSPGGPVLASNCCGDANYCYVQAGPQQVGNGYGYGYWDGSGDRIWEDVYGLSY